MDTQKITQRPNADDIVLSASGNRWLAIGIGAERFFNDYELVSDLCGICSSSKYHGCGPCADLKTGMAKTIKAAWMSGYKAGMRAKKLTDFMKYLSSQTTLKEKPRGL